MRLNAVDQHNVGIVPLSAHSKTGAIIRLPFCGASLGTGDYARRQGCQLQHVSSIDGQIHNAPLIDDGGKTGVSNLQHVFVALDSYGFRLRSGSQGHIDRFCLGHIKMDAGLDLLGKPRSLNLNRVKPNGHGTEFEISARVRIFATGLGGLLLCERDVGATNQCLRCVDYVALDGSGRSLSIESESTTQNEERR